MAAEGPATVNDDPDRTARMHRPASVATNRRIIIGQGQQQRRLSRLSVSPEEPPPANNGLIIDGELILPAKSLPDNRIITSKYTLWNFLPKNLFEQFRRIANFYFLCIAVIQVSTNSPVSPVTSLAPLIFVVVTTALKQGYEDWLRHKTDRAVNNRLVPVLYGPEVVRIKSDRIRCGDIVKVVDEIPCDLVMLSSDDIEGKAHVTTANLDGETNLKLRECLPVTKLLQTPEQLATIRGFVDCEKPNTDLYEFVGILKILDKQGKVNQYPLGPSNLLVRGSRLKNNAFVFGVAVYTGPESKLALNSRLTSNKFSTIERMVNIFLLIYLILLVIASVTSTVLKRQLREKTRIGNTWYLQSDYSSGYSTAGQIFEDFLAFFVIYNYVIPISLYVTLETVKFMGSRFMVNDPQLVEASDGEKPKCNSSDLNEELGQVEYIFSDKTGTLTENIMAFRSCSVNGMIYREDGQGKLYATNGDIRSEEVEEFFVALALCNTVQVNTSSESDTTLDYLADSPDEKALVEAAAKHGVQLISASTKEMELSFDGGAIRKVYSRLQVFEFDSVRKRMSVIVQAPDGKLFMFTKGAESEMATLITAGKMNETYGHIDDYGRQGLRTLAVAMKELTADDYQRIEQDLAEANSRLENRRDHVTKVYIETEAKLRLLGASAVEDRLQEEVPEVIEDLKRAGIHVWVLTGDKLETAISVAYSCHLLDADMTQVILARQPNSETCGECIKRYWDIISAKLDTGTRYALIVDGRSLQMAMNNHLSTFRDICLTCTVVLCCRMSPIQKGDVVHMVKMSKSKPVTAAIGDGANDVSMIQEAHVGFGLMGREGRQALNSADFAFSKFKHLRRVLLVHGNLFYHRVTVLIHYFFYKNVIFVTPQFLYAFYNAFSSQTLYHGMLLMLYNMIFTSTPILVFGVVERHISHSTLLRRPALYNKISRNQNMKMTQFFKWFFNGVVHGIIIFYFFVFLWEAPLFADGQNLDLHTFGISIYHCVIIVANLKLCIFTKYWNWVFMVTLLLSLLSVPLIILLYSSFRWGILNDDLYGVYWRLMCSYNYWLAIIIAPIIVLLPDFVYLVMYNTLQQTGLPAKSTAVSPQLQKPRY